jgi:hypothetical protein
VGGGVGRGVKYVLLGLRQQLCCQAEGKKKLQGTPGNPCMNQASRRLLPRFNQVGQHCIKSSTYSDWVVALGLTVAKATSLDPTLCYASFAIQTDTCKAENSQYFKILQFVSPLLSWTTLEIRRRRRQLTS